MKKGKLDQSIPEKQEASSKDDSNANNLAMFFGLLFEIDKRNHPEKYGYQKYRDSADQTPSGIDWNSPPRI
jgi:hypothetical protein